jgi:ABC-type Co2+ transport system permease subunit
MTRRESTLTRAWRDTDTVRRSLAWWLLAVASSATLAVVAYYISPDGSSLSFAFAGIVIGFFAPYAVALVRNLLGARGRQPDGITQRR